MGSARNLLLIACVLAVLPSASRAQDPAPNSYCNTGMTRASFLKSDASKDLYDSLLWFAGAGAVNLGTKPSSRWTGTNDTDEGLRNAFRAESTSSRKAAGLASDVLLGFSVGLMPVAAISRTLYQRDCEQAFDMATDVLESAGLTLFLTESVKVIAGRERPFVKRCDINRPKDAECGSRDRVKSFFSGHASLAAAGAGVSCAFSIKRKTWGDSTTAQAVPCALGATAALATGILRMTADRHWGTDVLVGFGVGALVGYFDTWGPFEWLQFETDAHNSDRQVQGLLIPYGAEGAIGARLSLRF